jgi:Xaa-Pro aminopeptidase
VRHVAVQHRTCETVPSANSNGRETAAPGVTCDRLDRETTAVLATSAFGHLVVQKTGHGLRLDVQKAPQVMVGDETALAPGIIVTTAPGLHDPGHVGVRIEDGVLITDDGRESLTSMPREVLCFG